MTANPTPSFPEFLEMKGQVLAGSPDILDCTETRMAQVLAALRANPVELDLAPQGYRCHVADHWLAHFGLPAAYKPRALVSQGVRQSLLALFTHYAEAGKRVLLPSDVYPVYLDLARQAGVDWAGYPAWEGFEARPPQPADVLVLTNPLKPRGVRLPASDADQVLCWLQADPRRRAVIDAVYTFEPRLDPSTRRLYDHGQTLVLHSLSKGWAQPLVAGVALVPEQDVAVLTNVFRSLPVPRETLNLAEALLERDGKRPELLARHLWLESLVLARQLARRKVPVPASLSSPLPGQYLFPVDTPWTHLLEQHNVLALPLSVFGSPRQGCVVSSLR